MCLVRSIGLLAQLVEQMTLNHWVEGSIPPQPMGAKPMKSDKSWCESILKRFVAASFFIKKASESLEVRIPRLTGFSLS